MNVVKFTVSIVAASLAAVAVSSQAASDKTVDDAYIAKQRMELQKNTKGKGYGPQSPRDIDSIRGKNPIDFSMAPAYTEMNLCNVHFHKNAEHKGMNFSSYAGNGNGKGYHTGFKFSGRLPQSNLQPTKSEICPGKYGSLKPGDTIEVHYVYTTADIKPGPTLGACLSDATKNPQLRVETQVFVLANDINSTDFGLLSKPVFRDGVYQANYIPMETGTPVQYLGSTTGPSYNEKGSPFQVTWSVRPKVAKLDINSVGEWCQGNDFDEDQAHGVRNLVTNPNLLSPIK